MNSVFFTHIFQASKQSTEVRDQPFVVLTEASHKLRRLTFCNANIVPVLGPHSLKESLTRVETPICGRPMRLVQPHQVIILSGKEAVKKITRGNEDVASQNIANFVHYLDHPPQHSANIAGIALQFAFQNIKLHVGQLCESNLKLKHPRIEHSFDPQTISTEGEFNQLLVPSFGRSIRALHGHNRPSSRSDCQQARQQRLKIEYDVAPWVPARLAFNPPRRSKQYWQDNRSYQHEGPENHDSLLIARSHNIPRQRHSTEVSHFSRESGSRLQPKPVAAKAVTGAGLFWRGCAA